MEIGDSGAGVIRGSLRAFWIISVMQSLKSKHERQVAQQMWRGKSCHVISLLNSSSCANAADNSPMSMQSGILLLLR